MTEFEIILAVLVALVTIAVVLLFSISRTLDGIRKKIEKS